MCKYYVFAQLTFCEHDLTGHLNKSLNTFMSLMICFSCRFGKKYKICFSIYGNIIIQKNIIYYNNMLHTNTKYELVN